MAKELKTIYRAESAEMALKRLEEFDAGPLVQVSDDRRELETQLAGSHPVLQLPAGTEAKRR